jgi:hypothetical protein
MAGGDGDSAAGTGVLTAAAEAALARRVEELRARASTRRAAAEAAGRNQLAHVSEWARRGGTALALALAAARGGWFDDADEHTAVVAAEAALAAAGLSGAPALGGGDGNGGGMRRLPLAGARLLEVGMGSGLHAMLQGLEAAARRWATSARTPARECGLLSLRNRLCGRQAGGRLARALLMCVWWRRWHCRLAAVMGRWRRLSRRSRHSVPRWRRCARSSAGRRRRRRWRGSSRRERWRR